MPGVNHSPVFGFYLESPSTKAWKAEEALEEVLCFGWIVKFSALMQK